MNRLQNNEIYKIILSALFASLIIVCSWITFPTAVPFTMQLLAVFLTSLLLELKYSLLSVIIYLVLGIAGLPVFSGFQGGLGVLLGPTGGYIIGFFLIALVVGIFKKFINNNPLLLIIPMIFGLCLCYFLGTLWFSYISKVDFLTALALCVAPYFPFDIIKIILSYFLYSKLCKFTS